MPIDIFIRREGLVFRLYLHNISFRVRETRLVFCPFSGPVVLMWPSRSGFHVIRKDQAPTRHGCAYRRRERPETCHKGNTASH